MDTKYRSTAIELMDDFGMQGEELTDALEKIAWINRVLGGNKLSVSAVQQIARKYPGRTLHILDLGCGNGDMLRAIAEMGKQEGFRFRLTGVDANPFTVAHAESVSAGYDNISYACDDILAMNADQLSCDVVLLTLTLHHFTDREIVQLLRQLQQHTRLAIVINDLQRSRLAYRLFELLSFAFRLGKVNRVDGRLSILRGFKRAELEAFARQLNTKQHTIQWKWAFRYRWIIKGYERKDQDSQ
ncbi:methyltransferase domain-containing protein [Taibaiella koreensis]|uniref:methyltransferase domain-containing protein n=1 Tax=Taibaiella koreensis TaxID=1268548 RepID=UPI0019697A20|nr:methyltransferase domain-containing protein [Taibaiella koreensis]